jgi:hypothetical protein
MPVNLSLFTNTSDSSLIGLGQGIDTASGGVFGVGLLLAIYLISYTVTNYYGSRDAFVVTSFIGVISAILLRLMGWLQNDIFVFGAIVLVAIAGVMLVFREGSN